MLKKHPRKVSLFWHWDFFLDVDSSRLVFFQEKNLAELGDSISEVVEARCAAACWDDSHGKKDVSETWKKQVDSEIIIFLVGNTKKNYKPVFVPVT